jgi:hypothetical protein
MRLEIMMNFEVIEELNLSQTLILLYFSSDIIRIKGLPLRVISRVLDFENSSRLVVDKI